MKLILFLTSHAIRFLFALTRLITFLLTLLSSSLVFISAKIHLYLTLFIKIRPVLTLLFTLLLKNKFMMQLF